MAFRFGRLAERLRARVGEDHVDEQLLAAEEQARSAASLFQQSLPDSSGGPVRKIALGTRSDATLSLRQPAVRSRTRATPVALPRLGGSAPKVTPLPGRVGRQMTEGTPLSAPHPRAEKSVDIAMPGATTRIYADYGTSTYGAVVQLTRVVDGIGAGFHFDVHLDPAALAAVPVFAGFARAALGVEPLELATLVSKHRPA
jgi:hypothetical protein